MTANYWAFLGVSLLVIVTPGPDTALTIRNTLLGGRTGGMATAIGVAIGQIMWACAASLGVVTLLTASEPLFAALRYAGAAYLVYLGSQSIRSAWRQGRLWQRAENGPRHEISPVAAFRQGVISNLGNPKMVVFFATLLPQFVPAGASRLSELMLLGASFSLLTATWLTLYALALATAGHVLHQAYVRGALETLTGAVLIGLGLRLATGHR